MRQFHEISEARHRILNPFSEAKLALLGEICQLQPGMRLLDLCCGKGELLCTWARRWGIGGTGVDLSPVFLEAARRRQAELAVEQLEWVEADAALYRGDSFDLVSCLGATWIGHGLSGTLRLMQASRKPGGLLLVGECWWRQPPPAAGYAACGLEGDTFTSLDGTLDRIEAEGLELVEMVQADDDSWDRYVAAQWRTVHAYLREHPERDDLRQWNRRSQRAYLEYERALLGWGVFVLI